MANSNWDIVLGTCLGIFLGALFMFLSIMVSIAFIIIGRNHLLRKSHSGWLALVGALVYLVILVLAEVVSIGFPVGLSVLIWIYQDPATRNVAVASGYSATLCVGYALLAFHIAQASRRFFNKRNPHTTQLGSLPH